MGGDLLYKNKRNSLEKADLVMNEAPLRLHTALTARINAYCASRLRQRSAKRQMPHRFCFTPERHVMFICLLSKIDFKNAIYSKMMYCAGKNRMVHNLRLTTRVNVYITEAARHHANWVKLDMFCSDRRLFALCISIRCTTFLWRYCYWSCIKWKIGWLKQF